VTGAPPLAHRPKLAAGLLALGLVAGPAVLSRFWTPLPPGRIAVAHKLSPPLVHGLLGTDPLGRDVLSMLMVGAWNSFLIAVTAVALGASIGVALGIFASGRGGLLEGLVLRACDVLFAVPPILSAMLIGAFLGTGPWTAVIAISSFMVPVFARLAVGSARPIWARDFCLAARMAGRGRLAISLDHILPNIAPVIAVQAALQLGLAVLTESGLSFLGFGLPPPAPTLGRMLADAETYLGSAPWLAIAPGATIALAVLGFNLLGDGLAEHYAARPEDGR
jgi:peptide/nickel transport system permease protein